LPLPTGPRKREGITSSGIVTRDGPAARPGGAVLVSFGMLSTLWRARSRGHRVKYGRPAPLARPVSPLAAPVSVYQPAKG